jgi:glycosyltransferase involved in cell wall biosynthesis
MKGLFAWIGFRQVAIEYDRDPRFSGETKWNYWRLWNFALEGITSFSAVPLKLASYVGLLAALFGFSYAGWIIFKTLVYGDPVAGYPSLMVVILCMGGIQLLGIGILGEYLARTFDETKHRPLYLVKDFRPSSLHQGSKIENTS